MKSLRSFLRANDGLAAVELTLVAPLLLTFMLWSADVGWLAIKKTWTQYAADAGTTYAMANINYGFSATAVAAAVSSSTQAVAISASPTPTEWYGCPNSTGTAIIKAASASSTCSSTGNTAGTYVTVTATTTFKPILAIKGISYPSSISTTAIVRVQ